MNELIKAYLVLIGSGRVNEAGRWLLGLSDVTKIRLRSELESIHCPNIHPVLFFRFERSK